MLDRAFASLGARSRLRLRSLPSFLHFISAALSHATAKMPLKFDEQCLRPIWFMESSGTARGGRAREEDGLQKGRGRN
jgi:hypothetical protein